MPSRKQDTRVQDKPDRGGPPHPVPFVRTPLGCAYHADSVKLLQEQVVDEPVDLIVTSPPFGLVRKKDYGNADADSYVEWFKPFAKEFNRVLKPSASLVIDIGGSWVRGLPIKSLYQYELLIALCREFGFHLAQEFYWWNPSRLPTPAEWVNVRRVRVKDAVNTIFWLSKTPWPKASNRRVLQPYSDSLLANGYKPKKRPSGHDISEKFSIDNGASIPPNLIAVANTESNSRYLRYCEETGLPPHPARFPSAVPEFFIRMLTDKNDLVLDPFAGSCVTAEVAERLNRRWICGEIVGGYLKGAQGRFQEPSTTPTCISPDSPDAFYKIARPGLLWNGHVEPPLPMDGGKARPNGQYRLPLA